MGILEPGEVYLHFSRFADEMSGFSGGLLNGVDVLVARSPAHLVSDIQKVRAVFKVELLGLKDVIVFSTKGSPSLAAKLSGGDYDGDIAWVCWESSLVDNFTNADIPECPDLVKEGFLRKDSTTYEELVKGHAKPTSTFLKRSFAFNMQPSLLGICTVHKDAICYYYRSVNTRESVFLSTLLSALVDSFKQGFIFTGEDWARFKSDVIKIIPQQPHYKTDHLDPNANHIIDYLKWVAKKAIDTALTQFHEGLPDPPQWDKDLVTLYKLFRELAATEPQLQRLLDDLDADIKPIKAAWASHGHQSDEMKPSFMSFVVESYEKFQAIRPHEATLVTKIIQLDGLSDSGLSYWAFLKASALFASYTPFYVSNAVWYLAGRQLVQLKAKSVGGGIRAMIQPMYAMMKPDASYVKALSSEDADIVALENRGLPANEEPEEMNDDD